MEFYVISYMPYHLSCYRGITVKSKVYFYPKIWVVLPVIQMTQIMGYRSVYIFAIGTSVIKILYALQQSSL